MLIERVKLSEFFAEVKKPEHIIGTTFSLSLAFFESVVLPHITRSKLRSCIIIADRVGYERALLEGPALKAAGQIYSVVAAPWKGAFHPKVWLSVSDEKIGLLVGSGNLTQAGFIENAEYFDCLIFDKDHPAPKHLFDSICSFVGGLTQLWLKESELRPVCLELFNKVETDLSSFQHVIHTEQNTDIRFLHSFSGNLIEQLPTSETCKRIYVAAPFFAGSSGGIDQLKQKHPEARFRIYPAIHAGRKIDLPIQQVASRPDVEEVASLVVESKKKDFKHLKLYGFESEDESWLFCTSANCTKAAWGSQNIEAGIIRKVDPDLLDLYFQGEKVKFPEHQLEYESEGQHAKIDLVASDNGTGIELSTSLPTALLPLKDVTLRLRVASDLWEIRLPTLFASTARDFIRWDAFKSWTEPRNFAVLLELCATDNHADKRAGACFIDNQVLLTSDPLHKSAVRCALDLIEGGVIPNLSNLSAIYSLATNILNGESLTKSRLSSAKKDSDDDDAVQKEEVRAIWPPVPVVHERHQGLSLSGNGQLQLCQKLIETLITPTHKRNSMKHTVVDTEYENGEDEESEAEKQRRTERDERLAKSMWRRAESDYKRLSRILYEIVPNQDNAQNIWPVAIMVFLTTMAVRRKAEELASASQQIPAAGTLVTDFRRLLFNKRNQGRNFVPPQGYRYRTEDFPPLCDDLQREFRIAIHEDLALVMLTIIADEKLRLYSQSDFQVMSQNRAGKVWKAQRTLSETEIQTCLDYWKEFIGDTNQGFSESEFTETLKRITPQEAQT